ncbi:MAG: competence/damage-inducible protein A [bacterium]
MSSAVILVIGDEILHGEIEDQNGPWLISELNNHNVDVERCCILPDTTDIISRTINQAFDDGADYILTTGGVGPTHDDRTLEAVGQALNSPLKYDENLIQVLEDNHGDLTASQKKMARLPEGTEFHLLDNSIGMAFEVGDIYVFPGFPELLKPLFFKLQSNFEGDERFLETIQAEGLESDIAPELEELQEEFPELQFGSYPHTDGSITLKIRGRDPELIERARDELEKSLDRSD